MVTKQLADKPRKCARIIIISLFYSTTLQGLVGIRLSWKMWNDFMNKISLILKKALVYVRIIYNNAFV